MLRLKLKNKDKLNESLVVKLCSNYNNLITYKSLIDKKRININVFSFLIRDVTINTKMLPIVPNIARNNAYAAKKCKINCCILFIFFC